MNDIAKTAVFAAAAALVGLIAWLAGPAAHEPIAEMISGEQLFPEFTEPDKAAVVEIVKLEKQDSRSLKLVEQDDEEVTIASHGDFPGDDATKRKLREVRQNLTGLKIVGVAWAANVELEETDADEGEAGEENGEEPAAADKSVRDVHNDFGVVDPQDEALTSDTCVGSGAGACAGEARASVGVRGSGS